MDRVLDVIYSPLCEASAAFLGLLEEWLQGNDIYIEAQAFCDSSLIQRTLYENNALYLNGRRVESCFVDVFWQGRLIDSVPLNRDKIREALHLDIAGDERPEDQTKEKAVSESFLTVEQFRLLAAEQKIAWLPLSKDTYENEMTMCLCHYPHGNPPERFHQRCLALKKPVFDEVWLSEQCAGVYAQYEDRVLGLIEVFPREVVRKHGFLAGTNGVDEDCLTIGCYEVGSGVPRIEMLDELMRQLLKRRHLFSRKRLEGIGVMEWPEGFTPYWVYDKYGFHRSEDISTVKFVMELAW